MSKTRYQRKSLTDAQRRKIAGIYKYKCHNIPNRSYNLLNGNNDYNIIIRKFIPFEDYKCPLYITDDGSFTYDNNYEIDHAYDLQFGGEDDISNLYPLCKKCHRQKTNNAINLRSNIRNADLLYNLFQELNQSMHDKEILIKEKKVLLKQKIKNKEAYEEELNNITHRLIDVEKERDEINKKMDTMYNINNVYYITDKDIQDDIESCFIFND